LVSGEAAAAASLGRGRENAKRVLLLSEFQTNGSRVGRWIKERTAEIAVLTKISSLFYFLFLLFIWVCQCVEDNFFIEIFM